MIERGIDLVQRGCGLHRRPRSLLVPNCGSTHLTYWCAGRSARRGGTAPRRLAAWRLELDVTAAAWEWLALSGFDPL
ncbi:MAG: hypothetical protein ACR2FQ_00405 [Pseudonocardiaceae bacterium]